MSRRIRKAGGDVQAVSIPSRAPRRRRNGIEVCKQRRHRRCSGALLLINLVLPLSQVAAETDVPGRRPTRSGAHVLACRSPELFVAQAWEFTRSGIVNSGDCVQFEDTYTSWQVSPTDGGH